MVLLQKKWEKGQYFLRRGGGGGGGKLRKAVSGGRVRSPVSFARKKK